ncbi:helix-turn-helix domain-containing protein [Actinomyces howellii]|uniref:helix-turn-helix domain-containing protein n=1 Tax=Actinomyces howellii TaxID=52771 RepID=UPI0013DEF80F
MVRGTGHGRRLGAQGRGAIAAGLARGDSLASIARFLGVAVSTVSREVAAGGGRQGRVQWSV